MRSRRTRGTLAVAQPLARNTAQALIPRRNPPAWLWARRRHSPASAGLSRPTADRVKYLPEIDLFEQCGQVRAGIRPLGVKHPHELSECSAALPADRRQADEFGILLGARQPARNAGDAAHGPGRPTRRKAHCLDDAPLAPAMAGEPAIDAKNERSGRRERRSTTDRWKSMSAGRARGRRHALSLSATLPHRGGPDAPRLNEASDLHGLRSGIVRARLVPPRPPRPDPPRRR